MAGCWYITQMPGQIDKSEACFEWFPEERGLFHYQKGRDAYENVGPRGGQGGSGTAYALNEICK